MKAKKTRNLEQSRREILDVAFLMIFRHGFQGVSVDKIIAETNLTKGAFYHHFPTKLDLGYALVDEVLKEMILDRWVRPLAAYRDPLQGILKQLQKHIGDSPAEHLQYGCPLNNLVQEMSSVDEPFRMRLQSALTLWIDETEKHIKRAQDNNIIQKDLRAREIAEFIVMSHEGFYGIIKGLGGDKRVFDALYKSLKVYFDSIRVTGGR